MKLRILPAALIIASIFTMQSCKKDSVNNDPGGSVNPINPNPTVISDMVVPESFDYATTHEVIVDVALSDGFGTPFKGIKVSLYDGQFEPGSNPKELYTGFTGADGKLNNPVSLPTYIKEVVVYPFSIGIPNNITVPVNGNAVKFHYTNGEVQSRMIETPANGNTPSNFSRKAGIEDFFSKKLGDWNTDGKPNYLESQRDVLSAAFLANISASFPEGKKVPIYHPEYLLETNTRNLNITELADVWITFVHEGAGYRNALLYYTYHKDSVPTKEDDIDSLYIVFPNASYSGSGGGLSAGDKVKIGRFNKDYVVAFAIAADGYNISSDIVTKGKNMWYTDKNLNVGESKAEFKQHTALLHDAGNNRFVIGFEDLVRSGNASDDDFNDVIFFATSNPVDGIDIVGVPPIDTPVDTDGDGVNDVYDDYPNDNTKAYDRFFPSSNDYGTMAFEDLWPFTGDYDMNDLIVRWRFHAVANAQNNVVELNCKTYAAAKGGSFPIGFGVEFPFNASAVTTATGTDLTKNRTTLAANGLESGNTKAVLIFFDNAEDQFTHTSGSFFNTLPSSGVSPADTINTKMTFGSAISFGNLGTYPFNPFVFVSTRDKEVHLPDHANTARANVSLFGTGKDNTIPSQGRYYKTKDGLPWAMHIPTNFEYPVEKTPIIEAYNNFAAWAQSGGTNNEGWYLNVTGNRTESKIYQR